jgi:hypothetical protein
MPKKNKNHRSGRKPLNNYVRYSAIGFQMAVVIFIFTYGGVKVDEWLGLKIPVFTLLLSLASVVLSIYYFIKGASKIK